MYTRTMPTLNTATAMRTVGITPTLELRWFQRGSIPVEVFHWFQVNCLGQRKQTQERWDHYLYVPGCNTISLKLRQGNLELKHYQGPLTMLHEGRETSRDYWEGQSEQWIKWSYPMPLSCNNPEEVDFFQGQLWIKVKKRRWQRHYQNVDIELTEITVESELWWSIALEAPPQDARPEVWFSQRVSDISQTYRGPALLKHHCYAYPAWLGKHFCRLLSSSSTIQVRLDLERLQIA